MKPHLKLLILIAVVTAGAAALSAGLWLPLPGRAADAAAHDAFSPFLAASG